MLAKPVPPAVGVLPHVETGVDRATLDRIYSAMSTPARRVPRPPEAGQAVRDPRRRCSRPARSTGRWPSRWPSDRCCSRAPTSASPARTRGAARSPSATRCSSTTRPAPSTRRWPTSTPTRASSGSTTRCCRSTPRSASSTATRSSTRTRSCAWEAQFGDFVNGAQIVIDQYIAAAEDKWGQTSGLVLLLPARLEGQGPEHSSARIERFLTLCAEDNMQVCNASTSAQYFHLLRRQMRREVRKPLVIFTPKSLLRAKSARSPIEALTDGSFEEVLDDASVTDRARCSGSWCARARSATRRSPVATRTGYPAAVLRLEQLYPFPTRRISRAARRATRTPTEVGLAAGGARQHGPAVVRHRAAVAARARRRRPTARSAAAGSGSPATGSHAIHTQEQEDLLVRTFEGL